MYATIRSYSGGDLAEALIERQEDVKGVIAALDGFRSYHLLRTAEGTTSISVFDDQAGAEASTAAAANWIAGNLPDASFGAPQVTTGEVVVSF
jgi:heme-degrading monooxygenase HmoA